MIKQLTIVFLLFLSYNIEAQNDISRFVKLTVKEKQDLKSKFTWTSDVLIINFYLPKKFADNPKENFIANKTWWKDFYKPLDEQSIEIAFVYSDCAQNNQVVIEGEFVKDEENFIRKTFLKHTKACYGIIAVNQNGDFKIKLYDYTFEEIKNIIAELRE